MTDSTACLPASWVDALSDVVKVVPLNITVDGETYVEGETITAAEVAAAQKDGLGVTTGRPAPARLLEAYQWAKDQGATSVVSAHIPVQLSSTVSSAQLAAAESPIPVRVLPEGGVGMALGFAVDAGAQVARGGGSTAEVAECIETVLRGTTTLIYVDSLETLRKGGRLGRAGAFFGTALAIKPLLTLKDGMLAPRERVRTRGKALERMLKLTRDSAATVNEGPHEVRVAVHSLEQAAAADAMVDSLAEEFGDSNVVHAGLGSAILAHVGAGTVATVVSPVPVMDLSTD